MSMMKESEAVTAVDDTLEVATDFTGRVPFNGYTTNNYKDYAPLMNLKDTIDVLLAKLFSGDLDQYNHDVLDNIVFDNVILARRNLEEQKVNHDRTINGLVDRRFGDINRFESQQERLKKDLELADYEFERLLELYKRYEFKNGGRCHEEE